MKRLKKRLKWALCILAAVCVIAVAAFCVMTGKPHIPAVPEKSVASLTAEENYTLASLRREGSLPLYVMEYDGDYDKELRAEVYKALGMQLKDDTRGCSTFAAKSSAGTVFGRNNDFYDAPVMLLYTKPSDGYASVSMVDLSLAGFESGQDIAGLSLAQRTKLLYAPFIPSDGMNECGLAIGTMYVQDAKYVQENAPAIFSLEAIRLVLDHAKDTAEAISLLEEYQIEFPVLPSHFLIADKAGDMAVIEFINGEMQVIRSGESWQAATNFKLSGSEQKIKELAESFAKEGKVNQDINGRSYWRYLTIQDTLRKTGDRIDSSKAMDLLQAVSLRQFSLDVWMITQWSVVYNLDTGSIVLAIERDFDHPVSFELFRGE